MEKTLVLFEHAGDSWESKFEDLQDNFDNKDLEISNILIFFDKNRPDDLLNFILKKFGIKGPLPFIKQNKRTQKLKQISQSFKSQEDVNALGKYIKFLRLNNRK